MFKENELARSLLILHKADILCDLDAMWVFILWLEFLIALGNDSVA